MTNTRQGPAWREVAPALCCTLMLAGLFSQVDIQIEGAGEWAVNLPTWWIGQHWLLDIFFGGRPMTGYHAFVLPSLPCFFHFPLCFVSQWTVRRACLVLACLITSELSRIFYGSLPPIRRSAFANSTLLLCAGISIGYGSRRLITGRFLRSSLHCFPFRTAFPVHAGAAPAWASAVTATGFSLIRACELESMARPFSKPKMQIKLAPNSTKT